MIWLIQKGKDGVAVRALDLALNDEVFRAHDKVPRQIRFVDSLPATGAGKVLRRMLAELP